MNRAWTALVVIGLPLLGWAQDSPSNSSQPAASAQPYTPAVPQASMVAGYGGFPAYSGGASTVAGSAMNGMASVISARGDAALSASAAAINLTQAEKQEIQNRQAATSAYFEMRATNRAARATERGPSLSFEQLAKIAHDGVPKPLNSRQSDPVSGKLNWPGPLQDDSFATQRRTVDSIMSQHARYGSLSYADQTKLKNSVNTMFKDLKSQVDSLPASDYLEAKSFLNSLLYVSTKSQLT